MLRFKRGICYTNKKVSAKTHLFYISYSYWPISRFYEISSTARDELANKMKEIREREKNYRISYLEVSILVHNSLQSWQVLEGRREKLCKYSRRIEINSQRHISYGVDQNKK